MRNISMLKFGCFFLPILMATQLTLADIANEMEMEEAEKLYEAGNYSQAEEKYQNVINNADPDKPEDIELVFQARRKLPLVYLATDQQSQAQISLQQLLTNHANHQRLPHAIHEIVEQAKKIDKTLQAGQVYQSILEAQPKHPQAIWLKMGIAITNAHLGNDEAVDSTLQNIITKNADDNRAAEALGQTAWAYRKLKQEAKARNVYKYVVDSWPNKDRAIFSQRGLVLCSIALGDQAGADAAIQKLLTDYVGSKYMPEIMRNIAGAYYSKGNLDKAVTLHQYVVDKYPENLEAIWSQRDTALCHIDAEDEQAVQADLQKLVTSFADHAQLPNALAGIGEHYRKNGDLQNARQIHQHVVSQFPTSSEAIWSQHDVVLCSLELGEMEAAQVATQELLQKFAWDKNISTAVWNIAQLHRDKLNWEHARPLCEYLVDKHSNTEISIWAQKALLYASISEKDPAAIDVGIQQLLSRFSSNKQLSEVAYWVAHELNQLDPAKAYELSEYISEMYPEDEFALYSKINLCVLQIRQDNDTSAEALFRKILTDYKGHPQLSEAVHLMAEGYWDKAFMEPRQDRQMTEKAKESLQKAMAKWEEMITQFPNAARAAQEHYLVGECYYYLGQYDKTIEYCQKVIDNWPDYTNAWYAPFRIVKANKKLLEAGSISESEADAKITAAFECIVKQFPDCPSAKVAQKGLNYYLKKSSEEEGGLR